MNTTRRHRTGFTIIELLVVVVIIGILTSVATASYITAQRHARDNARKAGVNAIANAVEAYYAAKRAFPGKQNTAIDGSNNTTDNSGNPYYRNCEQADSNGDYFYYFYPLDVTDTGTPTVKANTTPCDRRAAVTGSNGAYSYNPDDYKPFPVWIPGLSPYLSPVPQDPHFLDKDGNDNGQVSDVLGAFDDSPSNQSRTFMYRHLKNGYAVYTRMESSTGDKDTIDGTQSAKTLSDDPKPYSGNPLTISGRYVYIIRK